MVPHLTWNLDAQPGTHSTVIRLTVAPSREQIERQVRHELVMLPYYGVFDRFAYQVDRRKVTLFGEVTRPVLKSDAEGVVKAIEGVERAAVVWRASSKRNLARWT
jgi:hypothetical protein